MDKNSYALGMSIAHNMMSSGIKEVEFDDFAAGVKAVLTGAEPAVSFQEAGQLLDKYFAELEAEQKAQAEAMSAMMREEGEGFLAAKAKEEGVVVLPSGLQYKVITEGTGKKPTATDQVKCHYEGTFVNGTIFDSSYRRNEPQYSISTRLSQVGLRVFSSCLRVRSMSSIFLTTLLTASMALQEQFLLMQRSSSLSSLSRSSNLWTGCRYSPSSRG